MFNEENVLRIQGIATLLPNQNAPQSEWISALPILEELIGEIQATQRPEKLELRIAEFGAINAELALQMFKRRHQYFSTMLREGGGACV